MLAQVTYDTGTSSGGLSGGVLAGVIAFSVVVGVLTLIGMWKVLVKGGEPGAFSLLNLVYCLSPFAFMPIMRMIGRPTWWALLLYVPFVNLVILAIMSIGLAKSFGKSTAFGVGLWLLGPIFYIILGFGSATYQGPVVRAA
jgi:hypothetical protein